MKRFSIVAIAIGSIAVTFAIALSLRPTQRTVPNDDVYGRDGPATKAAVLKIIPVGSQIGFAKSAMEAKGFHCAMRYDQKHSGYDPSKPGSMISFPAADFLWCDSGNLWGGWRSLILTIRWQVMFVAKDDTVAAVDVNIGLTGP